MEPIRLWYGEQFLENRRARKRYFGPCVESAVFCSIVNRVTQYIHIQRLDNRGNGEAGGLNKLLLVNLLTTLMVNHAIGFVSTV